MKKQNTELSRLEFLSSICLEKRNFRTNLAVLSLPDVKYPDFVNIIFLFVEYMQLMAQAIIINNNLHGASTNFPSNIFSAFFKIAKVFHPGHFLNFQPDSIISEFVLIVFICIIVLKYLLLFYVCLVAFKRIREYPTITQTWKFVVKFQSRVIYFFVTSILFIAIQTSIQKERAILGMSSTALTTLLGIFIGLELLLSINCQIHFKYLLPTKDLLSSKDNKIEIFTLFQKCLIQLLEISLESQSLSSAWIITLFNMAFCIIRNAYFIQCLPIFSLKAIQIQACLLMIVSSLDLGNLVFVIFKSSSEEDIPTGYIIVLQLMLAPLLVKAALVWISKTINTLVASYKESSAGMMIHKMFFLKDFLKDYEVISKEAKGFANEDLINHNFFAKLSTIVGFEVKFDHENIVPESKAAFNELVLAYLENMRSKYPKNQLIKLYIGFHYIKKLKIFAKGMRVLARLLQNCSNQIAMNALLVMDNLQKEIQIGYKRGKSYLDLDTYVRSSAKITQLKLEMMKQADIQDSLYREVKEIHPNLSKIFNNGQKIVRMRSQMDRKIRSMIEKTPDYCLHPIMVCAYYSVALNYSWRKYIQYCELYELRRQRYDRFLHKENLCQENLYEHDMGFALQTKERGGVSKVLYFSKSLEKAVGRDYTGLDMKNMVIPCLRNYFENEEKVRAESGSTSLTSVPFSIYNYNSQRGYMFESECYINLHPFINIGFCSAVIIRRVPTTKETLILNEEGYIEGFTQRIGKSLNLSFKSTHISSLSKELVKVNEAFNAIAHAEEEEKNVTEMKTGDFHKEDNSIGGQRSDFTLGATKVAIPEELEDDDKKTEHDVFKEIVSDFAIEGKSVTFSPLKDAQFISVHSKKLHYHCKIENKFFGKMLLKVLTLEETGDDDDSDKKPMVKIINRNTNEKPSDKPNNDKPTSQSNFKKFVRVDSEDEANVSSSIDMGSLHGDDEKKNGWIDFKQFEERHDQKGPSLMNRKRTILQRLSTKLNSPYLSDKSTPHSGSVVASKDFASPRVSASKEFISPRICSDRPLKNDHDHAEHHIPSKLNVESPKESAKIAALSGSSENNADLQREAIMKQETSSQYSTFTSYNKIESAFNNAVSKRYFSPSSQLIIALISLLCVGLWIQHFTFSLAVKRNNHSLRAKKQIIYYLELRNTAIIVLHGRTRLLWSFATGIQDEMDYPVGRRAIDVLKLNDAGIKTVGTANQQLFDAMNQLSWGDSYIFFLPDVPHYDTYFDEPQHSINVTNFQATTMIMEDALEAQVLGKQDLVSATSAFELVLRNGFNDLLSKSNEINTAFFESYQDQGSYIDGLNRRNLGTVLGVLGLVFIIFIIMAYIQYRTECLHILDLTRLKNEELEHLITNLAEFKRAIIENDSLEELDGFALTKLQQTTKQSAKYNKTNPSYYKDKDRNKNHTNSLALPNSRGVQRKYVQYLFRFIIFVMVVGGVIILNFTLIHNLLNKLNRELIKLRFSCRTHSMVNLQVTAARELTLDDENILVLNSPIVESFSSLVEILVPVIKEMPSIFQSSGTQSEEIILDIIYRDMCSYLPEAALPNCEKLKKGKSEVSLYEAVVGFQSQLADYQDQFTSSDKSAAELIRLREIVESVLMPYVLTFNALFPYMKELQNESLNELFDEGIWINILNIYFSSVVVVFGCLIINLTVVADVRDAENRFKNILPAFPIELILSNFILKSFLMRTSKNAFTLVKNNI